MKKEELKKQIHKVFMKHDLIGVIGDGWPVNEYQMEESKIWHYVYNNPNASEKEIYKELVRIIEDWFWESPLDYQTLQNLKEMSIKISTLTQWVKVEYKEIKS